MLRYRCQKNVITCAVFILAFLVIKLIWQIPVEEEGSLKTAKQAFENDNVLENIPSGRSISDGTQTHQRLSGDSSSNRKMKRKIIFWYKPPAFKHILDTEKTMDFSKCGFPNMCSHTSNSSLLSESDAVIFHGSLLPPVLPERRKNQVWIFYTLESPPSVHAIPFGWRKQFDWMMTYRRDSQVFLPYGKFFENHQDSYDFTNIMKQKDKGHPVAWLVSNCYAQNGRSEYVKEMQKYLLVDIFGKCGKPIVASYDDTSFEAYKTLSVKHKFYLSFENNHCKDYITEKLFNTYRVPLVPIVRGGASYSEMLPNGTYINTADFKSPKDLANHLKFLNENDDAYLKILQEKMKYSVYNMLETYQQSLCEICERIQNPLADTRTNRTDVSSWIRDNTCFSARGNT